MPSCQRSEGHSQSRMDIESAVYSPLSARCVYHSPPVAFQWYFYQWATVIHENLEGKDKYIGLSSVKLFPAYVFIIDKYVYLYRLRIVIDLLTTNRKHKLWVYSTPSQILMFYPIFCNILVNLSMYYILIDLDIFWICCRNRYFEQFFLINIV